MTCQSENFAEICKKFLCPIFHGCAFSVSNLSTELRTDVANLVVTNGGLYMGQMDKNKCTHLVIGTPGGKKHQYAKKWGITVVPLRWIRDSIKREYALSTDLPEYKIEDFDARYANQWSETVSQWLKPGVFHKNPIECSIPALSRFLVDAISPQK